MARPIVVFNCARNYEPGALEQDMPRLVAQCEVRMTEARDGPELARELADAEVHFDHGPLEGLKLIGFGVWERKTGNGRNVTFPARQYSVNGERRSFSLLRPIADTTSQERIRDLILQAYAEHEAEAAVAT